jgi:hypothetical protein
MNIYGSFTAESDFTHNQAYKGKTFALDGLSTASPSPTTYNTGTPNISNSGYTAIATTTAPVIFQLDIPYMAGLKKTIHCASLANTSTPALVYAGSTAFEACFLSVAGNTSNSMATMYVGSVLELFAISTAKWLVTGNCTAGSTVAVSFSSST